MKDLQKNPLQIEISISQTSFTLLYSLFWLFAIFEAPVVADLA